MPVKEKSREEKRRKAELMWHKVARELRTNFKPIRKERELDIGSQEYSNNVMSISTRPYETLRVD